MHYGQNQNKPQPQNSFKNLTACQFTKLTIKAVNKFKLFSDILKQWKSIKRRSNEQEFSKKY